MNTIYDRIGINYSVKRCTDPHLADQLYPELSGASRIVNIGAGTGSYEPENSELVAIEPSSQMISQRPAGSYPVMQAFAESLPFEDNSFSHAMTVLSIHHWHDRAKAFNEINRVATNKFVAITWDPSADPFWLTRDYFPEIYATDIQKFPYLNEFEQHFDEVKMTPLLIPDDCNDGFLAAFWKRPEAYLQSEVRQAMSVFSRAINLQQGLQKLKQDLDNGTWASRNHAIMTMPSLDAGYRLVTTRVRNAKVMSE